MNYLAIDTTASALIALARKGKEVFCTQLPDAASQHSVQLMPVIDGLLSRAGLALADCDFIACVVGPGSFTGVRIGISTVKGLCFAAGKPALAVTSFDGLAYAERGEKRLALVDAGGGYFYACGYGAENSVEIAPARLAPEQVERLVSRGYRAVREADRALGLMKAVEAKSGNAMPAEGLKALYLRKSAAEEGR